MPRSTVLWGLPKRDIASSVRTTIAAMVPMNPAVLPEKSSDAICRHGGMKVDALTVFAAQFEQPARLRAAFNALGRNLKIARGA